MTMTLDELRAEIERRRDDAEQNVARWTTAYAIANAELRAHDAAVEAASAGLPARPEPLGPDNLNGGRTHRRNIPDVVYETLKPGAEPMTTEELIEAVGDVRIGQIQAALLKLGDKVTTKPVQRMRNGYSAEVPGYIRSEEAQHE